MHRKSLLLLKHLIVYPLYDVCC